MISAMMLKNSYAPAVMRYAFGKKQNAITFIELLVVVIIIGILFGASIPQFRNTFDNLELENFVKDIYYLSHYLQGSAIGQSKIYYLNINKEEGKFQAFYKEGDEFKNIEGRFGKTYKTPQTASISTDPPDKNGIYFYPDGSIDKIKIALKNQYGRELSLIIKGAAGEIQIQ